METHADQIRRSVDEIPAGTTVTVRLKDGTEHVGTIESADTDTLHLSDSDQEHVELEQIDTFLITHESDGPE